MAGQNLGHFSVQRAKGEPGDPSTKFVGMGLVAMAAGCENKSKETVIHLHVNNRNMVKS